MKKYYLLLELFCFGGYPKDPFFGLPLGLYLIGFFPLRYTNELFKYGKEALVGAVAFSGYMILVAALSFEAKFEDIIFILVMFYKLLSNLCMAMVVIRLIENSKEMLGVYILVQSVLIMYTAFNFGAFEFLLGFQTNAAIAVFGELFGVRSLGFGVMHNEGVVLLALLYSITLKVDPSAYITRLNGILMYADSLSSRMVVILTVWIQALLARKMIAYCFIIGFSLIVFLGEDVEGPLSQVFELLKGPKEISSVNAIKEMAIAPENGSIGEWMFGTGKFFGVEGFYMNTDIGFSRLLFAGGLIGVFLYLAANFASLIRIRDWRPGEFVLFVTFTGVFIFANIKGINIQNWFQIALTYLLLSTRKKFVNAAV